MKQDDKEPFFWFKKKEIKLKILTGFTKTSGVPLNPHLCATDTVFLLTLEEVMMELVTSPSHASNILILNIFEQRHRS